MAVSKIVVISGDATMTRFMQDADVFEQFKVLASVRELEVHHTNALASVLEMIKEATEKAGHRVVAIFSPGTPEGAWRDPNIKVVSDGKKWYMLDNALKALGYQAQVVKLADTQG